MKEGAFLPKWGRVPNIVFLNNFWVKFFAQNTLTNISTYTITHCGLKKPTEVGSIMTPPQWCNQFFPRRRYLKKRR